MRLLLRDADVLGAGALRALAALERHRLAFAKFIEARAAARGLMKEVLRAVARGDESESLVRQPLDRAVHCRHCRLVRCLVSCRVGLEPSISAIPPSRATPVIHDSATVSRVQMAARRVL